VTVYRGPDHRGYGFEDGHPFGLDRLSRFWSELIRRGLEDRISVAVSPQASRAEIESFHEPGYVDRVIEQSIDGTGYLDYGDTPAFPGIYEASATVVGGVLDAVGRLMCGSTARVFIPIAGLHHARRREAGGFCVFNDCAVAIEVLRSRFGLDRIAYVDIDAHHGDGVFYGFEADAGVVIGDIHEDGRFLYPGTGHEHETGTGPAEGTKLNLPLRPGAGDDEFLQAWERVEAHVDRARPEFVILQCGADALAGDPLAHLEMTPAVHRLAASRLCALADRHCGGRVLALGGGGYNPQGIADGWCAVVEALLES
jgi:acetoin utilization protein AcuC